MMDPGSRRGTQVVKEKYRPTYFHIIQMSPLKIRIELKNWTSTICLYNG